jgi:hypothetical protein
VLLKNSRKTPKENLRKTGGNNKKIDVFDDDGWLFVGL